MTAMAGDPYLMWGYEAHLQQALESEARCVFEEIDPFRTLTPVVRLVGVRDGELAGRYPACVVPEDGTFKHAAFFGVNELAKRLEQSESGAHPAGQDPAAVRQEAVLKAVRQTVEGVRGSDGFVTFCSQPTPVAGYLVVVVLQLPRAAYDSYYRLQKQFVPNPPGPPLRVARSFLEAVVEVFLEMAADQITRPDPGSRLRAITDRDQVLQYAARVLMYTPALAGGDPSGLHGLVEACATISTLRYEGQEGVGAIVFAKPGHPDIEPDLQLTSPVALQDYGAVRKLLEMTTASLSLLCDSHRIYGLGRVLEGYDPTREDLFVVRFVRQFAWELRHAGQQMMYVKYGHPSLRLPGFPQERFCTDLRRVFPSLTAPAAQRLASLAKVFASQSHGCMLVISAEAEQEAFRMSNQCTLVHPVRLEPSLIPSLTSIDGGVIVDLEGYCRAIGVILDGISTPMCTPVRGARYNCAVRYTQMKKACVVVVKSEDGMVSILPQLPPQMRRGEIRDAIADFRKLTESTTIDPKAMEERVRWFFHNCSYLTSEQCRLVNALRRQVKDKVDTSGWRYQFPDLSEDQEPDPRDLVGE